MSRHLSCASTALIGLLLLALAATAVETLTITAARAIVRAKPGITHPILTVAPQGAIFPVLETQENWHKILLEDGREGWITHEVGRVEQEGGRLEWKDDSVDDGYGSTAPVGSYEGGKSPYGAYDMAGNVWEWVVDRYEAGYYQRSPARNPRGPASGAQVGVRGGSWLYGTLAFRTTVRSGVPPDRRNDNIGLRCVQAQ